MPDAWIVRISGRGKAPFLHSSTLTSNPEWVESVGRPEPYTYLYVCDFLLACLVANVNLLLLSTREMRKRRKVSKAKYRFSLGVSNVTDFRLKITESQGPHVG